MCLCGFQVRVLFETTSDFKTGLQNVGCSVHPCFIYARIGVVIRFEDRTHNKTSTLFP